MKAVQVAFKMLDDGEYAPPMNQQIQCHMIFDVKMDTFQRKAQYVAQGNMTEAPATLAYAAVNGLNMKTVDIANAFLQAPVLEKIWTICGLEFGPDEGRKAILVRALYGGF
eukprot:scaffold61252_cov61-Attheya_sp.AAC.4